MDLLPQKTIVILNKNERTSFKHHKKGEKRHNKEDVSKILEVYFIKSKKGFATTLRERARLSVKLSLH